MKTFTWILLAIGLPLLADSHTVKRCREQAFDDFKEEHGKVYASAEEEAFRYKTFSRNYKMIKRHNRKAAAGEFSFTLGINFMADLTADEIAGTMKGFVPPPQTCWSSSEDSEEERRRRRRNADYNADFYPNHNGEAPVTFDDSGFVVDADPDDTDNDDVFDNGGGGGGETTAQPLSDSFDWRKEKNGTVVSKVKNQGTCGSCWAFAATGALEAYSAIVHNKPVLLSEQNLVDCVQKANGCEGGWTGDAFEYVALKNGINGAESYAYEAGQGRCRQRTSLNAATCKGFAEVEASESALKDAVRTFGPVAVAVSSNRGSFHFYRSGVYFDEDCNSDAIDHAVLAVGYGTERNPTTGDSVDFWIVKNSWDESWGEDGYIRIRRNADNHCGIATSPIFPIVDP